MQGSNRTQKRHFKGGTYSGQGGGHGYHGQTRLHQQGTFTFGRYQPIQDPQQRPNPQMYTNTQGHKTILRTQQPKVQETVPHKCCPPLL